MISCSPRPFNPVPLEVNSAESLRVGGQCFVFGHNGTDLDGNVTICYLMYAGSDYHKSALGNAVDQDLSIDHACHAATAQLAESNGLDPRVGCSHG